MFVDSLMGYEKNLLANSSFFKESPKGQKNATKSLLMFYPSLHKLHVLCAYSDRINSSLHASTLQALKITKN